MPELPEVKIMSSFINHFGEDKKIIGIQTNNKSNKIDLREALGFVFSPEYSISSHSRGKELLINFSPDGNTSIPFVFTFAFTGGFSKFKGDPKDFPNHWRLAFETTIKEEYLIFRDMRRWGNWVNLGLIPSKKRSPCPYHEQHAFTEKLLSNFQKHSDFNKPIYELLLDQDWFNGIGNYLRAEILARVGRDPFLPAKKYLEFGVMDFLKELWGCLEHAYQLGGSQGKDWINPFGVDKTNFDNWLICYGKGKSMKDRHGRTFWYL